MENKFKRNIGVVAHVDAGKTTLTEQLIYLSGISRVLGSVDKGTTYSDTLDIEKQRGISVKSSEINFTYEDYNINIIDTPGHIDFIGEVERSLSILDGSIVVLSSVEGVQPQSELYFKSLRNLNVPTIFFINKLDRLGANPNKVLKDISKNLSSKVIPLQILIENENNFEVKDIFSTIDTLYDTTYYPFIEEIITVLSENNEYIIDEFLNESLTKEDLLKELKLQCSKALVYPLYYGVASTGYGVSSLLKGIIDFLPSPRKYDTNDLCALVYKVTHHKTLGQESHIKLYNGSICAKDEIFNTTRNCTEKISFIKKAENLKIVDLKSATYGDIIIAYGLNSNVGDVFGNMELLPKQLTIANPILKVQVIPKDSKDSSNLVKALGILQKEDPLLNMEWIKEKEEININIMGEIQLEILSSILSKRFNIDVTFSEASIIYKETLIQSGFAFESYTMPKPCWAVVKFLIEPLPKGTGIIFESKVKTEKIMLKYQREIEDNIPKILNQGLYGWKVTDIKITLIDGEHHIMHSRPGDFAAATAMALMKAFSELGMTLLEPIIKLKISAPEFISGKIINEIIQMRGSFDEPIIVDDVITLNAMVPASTSLDFPLKLGILSSGKASLSCEFYGYEKCDISLGKCREYIGVNPIDRAKYILFVRNAL